jgi:hypothetical protein
MATFTVCPTSLIARRAISCLVMIGLLAGCLPSFCSRVTGAEQEGPTAPAEKRTSGRIFAAAAAARAGIARQRNGRNPRIGELWRLENRLSNATMYTHVVDSSKRSGK